MRIRVALMLLALLAICSATSFLMAQNVTGQIVGTVKDSSGAVIANATVTVTNTDKNVVVRTIQTDASGNFAAPLLPIGHYSVTAEAAGFKKYQQSNIELNVGDKLTVMATMEVGTAREVVNVEANPLQVELQSATPSGLISGTQMRELALNARVYEQLVALVPGVTYGGVSDQLYIGVSNPVSGQSNQVRFQINGGRNTQNNWTVDGADNVDRGANLTLLFYPSVDAIAEFKVTKGDYSAESGRAGAGQINVITRGGTNRFHGSAYEFFRNDVLNANNYFNKPNPINATTHNPRSPLRYNNFGWNLGGPVYVPGHYNQDKSKDFFFFSQEFRRTITYSTTSATMPTADELKGTFTVPVCTAFSAPVGGTCTATGTQITSIDPVAAAYIKDIWSKLPLAPSTATRTVFNPLRNVASERQELFRFDHIFGPKLTTFFRYIHDNIPTVEPGGLFQGVALPGVATTSTNSPGHSYIGKATATFSPTLLAEIGYNYSFGAVPSDTIGLLNVKNSPDVSSTTKLPFAVTLNRIPNVSFTGGGVSGFSGFGPYNDTNTNHTGYVNVTKVVHSHSMKFGFSMNHYNKYENSASNNVGTFTYSGATGLGQPSTASSVQRAWANFLLGRVSTFSQQSSDLTADVQSYTLEAFAQDEWRARRDLTVTYGVRYSRYGAPYDGLKQASGFDPFTYVAANAPQLTNGPTLTNSTRGLLVPGTGDPLNGIITSTHSPLGQSVTGTPKLNFAPRLGIAWDPFGDGKTSIRMGYGMYFDTYAYSQAETATFNNPPFVATTATPPTTATNPGGSGFNVSTVPARIYALPIPTHTPYMQQWSLGVQRELVRGWFTDISYVGTKGTHLTGTLDLNMLKPGVAAASGLFAPGFINTTSNLPALNLFRPYLGYGPINALETLFNSNYNSLQAALQKRFRGDSLLNIAYTWSHNLTDSQGDTSSPQNTYNIRAEYGNATFDRTHVLSGNFVYELPWLQTQQGFVGHVLGGWEFSGIAALNSGLPQTVTTSGVDPALQGILGASPSGPRPDLIGNPNGLKTITQWFNTAAFAPAPAGRAGNAGRGVVRGPGFSRWDLSVFKNIKLAESVKLQFRAEAFNVWNHTNYNAVSTNITSASFGQITSARDPRVAQLALKLSF